MTDERNPKVTAAYRALGAEEPPRALDEAILAASRQPARSWTQRLAVPLALAAVVVLSVTVTLNLQLEQPGIEGIQAPPAAPPAAPQARVQERAQEQPQPQPQPLKLKPEAQLNQLARPPAKPEARRAEPKPFADAKSDRAPALATGPAPAQAPVAPPPAAAGNLASRGDSGSAADMRHAESGLRREEDRLSRDAEAAARAPQVGAALAKPAAEQPAKLAAETPEHELERIARLRAEGKHDEADKALAEFRKRHPDYRIAEDLLRRVERR